MASRVDVQPASLPPTLENLDGRDDRIEAMVTWFHENFENPANRLPYESAEGGYQWLWGGPYQADEQIGDAFPQAAEDEIAEAVEQIQADGIFDWSVSGSRLAEIASEFEPSVAEYGRRRMPPWFDRRAYTVVETTLYPQVTWNWSVHVTFVPGTTNQPLGNEFDDIASDDDYPIRDYRAGVFGQSPYSDNLRELSSLRELVIGLIELELMKGPTEAFSALENSREWISRLKSDSDLFVDDAIITHASPADWLPLAKLFGKGAIDTGTVSAIVITSNSAHQVAGYLLAYGGARIFLRLIHGVNFLQDAFVERLGNRIRRGDFDRGKKGKK